MTEPESAPAEQQEEHTGEPSEETPNCAYCTKEATEDRPFVACPVCHAPHHADCWEANRGCAKEGCQLSPAQGGPSGTHQPVTSPKGKSNAFRWALVALVCAAIGAGASIAIAVNSSKAPSNTNVKIYKVKPPVSGKSK